MAYTDVLSAEKSFYNGKRWHRAKISYQVVTNTNDSFKIEYRGAAMMRNAYKYNTTASCTGCTSATSMLTSNPGSTYKDVARTSWGYWQGSKTHSKQTKTVTATSKVTGSFGSSSVSVSTTFTATARPSYTVSFNANGGSGAPGSQTKWYGETLTLSTTKPTKTGHTFQGWATSAKGSVAYASGAKYTANSGTTLYAVWKANTYTITLTAQGAKSGKQATLTKTYNVALKLGNPGNISNLPEWKLEGWNTTYYLLEYTQGIPAGTILVPNGTTSVNAATTYKPVWRRQYQDAIAGTITAQRGKYTPAVEEGETAVWELDEIGDWAKVTIQDFKSSKLISANTINSMVLRWGTSENKTRITADLTALAKEAGTTDSGNYRVWKPLTLYIPLIPQKKKSLDSDEYIDITSVDVSKISVKDDDINKVYAGDSDEETSYFFSAAFSDTQRKTNIKISPSVTVAGQFYTMDFLAGGRGVSIGQAASFENTAGRFVVGFPPMFYDRSGSTGQSTMPMIFVDQSTGILYYDDQSDTGRNFDWSKYPSDYA